MNNITKDILSEITPEQYANIVKFVEETVQRLDEAHIWKDAEVAATALLLLEALDGPINGDEKSQFRCIEKFDALRTAFSEAKYS